MNNKAMMRLAIDVDNDDDATLIGTGRSATPQGQPGVPAASRKRRHRLCRHHPTPRRFRRRLPRASRIERKSARLRPGAFSLSVFGGAPARHTDHHERRFGVGGARTSRAEPRHADRTVSQAHAAERSRAPRAHVRLRRSARRRHRDRGRGDECVGPRLVAGAEHARPAKRSVDA